MESIHTIHTWAEIRKMRSEYGLLKVQEDILTFQTNISNAAVSGEIESIERQLKRDVEILELRKKLREASECRIDNGVADVTELVQKINDENEAVLNYDLHKTQKLQQLFKYMRLGSKPY